MKNDQQIDDLIDAGAGLLALPVEPDWKPSIRAHLAVTFRLARLIEDFPLPDDIEPAATFRA